MKSIPVQVKFPNNTQQLSQGEKQAVLRRLAQLPSFKQAITNEPIYRNTRYFKLELTLE